MESSLKSLLKALTGSLPVSHLIDQVGILNLHLCEFHTVNFIV